MSWKTIHLRATCSLRSFRLLCNATEIYSYGTFSDLRSKRTQKTRGNLQVVRMLARIQSNSRNIVATYSCDLRCLCMRILDFIAHIRPLVDLAGRQMRKKIFTLSTRIVLGVLERTVRGCLTSLKSSVSQHEYIRTKNQ